MKKLSTPKKNYVKFTKFLENSLRFEYHDGSGPLEYSDFNFMSNTDDTVAQYNAILKTVPPIALYEACLLGNTTALTIRERVAKGELIWDFSGGTT